MQLLELLQLLLVISNTYSFEQSLIWKAAKKIERIEKEDHARPAQSFSHHHDNKAYIPYDKLFDAREVEYATKIEIGTPPQEFTVALSTRFGVLAIPHPYCLGWCEGKKRFYFINSLTYSAGSYPWSMSVAGENVSGIVGNDTVTIGGTGEKRLHVPSATVGLATNVSLNLTDAPVDGLFGLGLKSSCARLVPILQTAYESNALKFPIFSIWLAPRPAAAKRTFAGAITYGAVDSAHCGPIISSVLVNSANFYKFKIQGVGMDRFRSGVNSEAVSDIGIWIRGPECSVSELAQIAGAEYNEERDLYDIPCNATPPAFEVYIEGDTYTVDHTNYIIQDYKGHCVLTFKPQKAPASTWVLGDPFIREYCHIYDFGSRRISFAESLTRPHPQPSPTTETTRRTTKQQESAGTTSVHPPTTTGHKGSVSTLPHAHILAAVLLSLLIIRL